MKKIDKIIDDFEKYIEEKPTRCGFALACEDVGEPDKHLSSFFAASGEMSTLREVEIYTADFLHLIESGDERALEFVQTIATSAMGALTLYGEKTREM